MRILRGLLVLSVLVIGILAANPSAAQTPGTRS
jgi:hypothetical protein